LTQLEAAKAGIITPEMKMVAESELVDVDVIKMALQQAGL